MAIADRLLNYDMLWAMVNKRFHKCLKEETESAVRMNQIAKLDDQDLVRNICPRERLTLYNFLKTHLSDQHRSSASKTIEASGAGEAFASSLNEERIKQLIHKEYCHYFRRPSLDIYRGDKMFRRPDSYNDLRAKFNIEFQ